MIRDCLSLGGGPGACVDGRAGGPASAQGTPPEPNLRQAIEGEALLILSLEAEAIELSGGSGGDFLD